MTAGTWHLTLVDDGEPGETQELDLEGVQDTLAEFFARAETEPRGIGFFVTRSATSDPVAAWINSLPRTYDEAVEYINAAPDRDERRRRKAEVFHLIYGMGGVKYTGTVTGRFTVAKPSLEEVRRGGKTRAGTPGHLRRVK